MAAGGAERGAGRGELFLGSRAERGFFARPPLRPLPPPPAAKPPSTRGGHLTPRIGAGGGGSGGAGGGGAGGFWSNTTRVARARSRPPTNTPLSSQTLSSLQMYKRPYDNLNKIQKRKVGGG